MVKMGRPLEHLVYDEQNNQVAGLSFDKGTKTYFASYKDDKGKFKKKTFGRDKIQAIDKFYAWKEYCDEGPPEANSYMQTNNFWAYARKVILENPPLAAELLDIPVLATDILKNYRPPKSHTLDEIGDNYFNKIEFKDLVGQPKLEYEKVKKSWERFCTIVKVKTVDQLTKEKIKNYYEQLYAEFTKKRLSTTWLRGYQERIIRVLNAAIKDLDEPADILTAKLNCNSVFKIPKNIIKNLPKIITKEALNAILKISSIEEKAMWLVSLNLAYYTADLVALTKEAIDLDNGNVIFRRTKNSRDRAGVLWQETIAAINDYNNEKPHNGLTLFVSEYKQAFASSTVSKKMKEVIERAKKIEEGKVEADRKYKPINLNYTHCHFRDSFQSICAQKNIQQRAIDAVTSSVLHMPVIRRRREDLQFSDVL